MKSHSNLPPCHELSDFTHFREVNVMQHTVARPAVLSCRPVVCSGSNTLRHIFTTAPLLLQFHTFVPRRHPYIISKVRRVSNWFLSVKQEVSDQTAATLMNPLHRRLIATCWFETIYL